MVTFVAAATWLVVSGKVAVVAPAATVTVAGTPAEALLLVSAITAPPAGAAAVSVTVPVLPAPPTTVAGFSVTEANGEFTVRTPVVEAPLYVAVMTTVVVVVTALLVTTNVAVVAPAVTVTEAGTVAALVLLLVSVTTEPPAGAAVASITVPVLPAPPITMAGLSVMEPKAGLTTSVTVFAAPP